MNDFENELKKQPMRHVPGHWRAQILAQATPVRERQPGWTALLWPSPKAWGTLAAAWALMIAFSMATREPTASEAEPQATHVRMAMEEKRKLQAEIEEASVHYEEANPKPRSETTAWTKSA